MKFDAHAYTVQTRKVTEDGETYYRATVLELPHLATYEDTAQAAYEVLIEDIEELHAVAVRMGHAFPQPNAETVDAHSGRITLRVPRTLHRKLDEKANSEGVSLNSCITILLVEGVAVANVAAAASASILAVTNSAVFEAGFVRGEKQGAAQQQANGYQSRTQFQSFDETEKWITQKH